MKKILTLSIFFSLSYSVLQAQSDIDALRYSTLNGLGSTARSMGLAGAVGAVGADPSSVLINPAGLAQYKSSAFNISLGMNKISNSSSYIDVNDLNSNLSKVNIPSLNFVFTERKRNRDGFIKKGWINYNFSMGMNRTADFNRRISYKGLNTQHSMLDHVAEFVQGTNVANLDANSEQLDRGFYYFENMFWYAYLIDTISNGDYYPYYDQMNPAQQQNGTITQSGGINEFNFSLAANYSHKVYFGVGVNIHSLRYKERNLYSETDNEETTGNWNYFDFTRNLSTSGVGYSGRLGLIVRPDDRFRLGLSIHTPTIYNLTDEYHDELYVSYDDGSSEDLRTIDKEYKYNILTPMRVGVQGAWFFGKRGFVSAEIENIDYAGMNIYAQDYDFVATNETIANKYQSATNIKLGGEYAINEFRLRAGYANQGNPFSVKSDFRQQFASLGFGIQESTWAFDLGLVRAFGKDQYVPYTLERSQNIPVKNNLQQTQLIISISTRF